MVLVFGLAIRGMYIWPVILYVNCSNSPCNIMTPLVSMLRTIKSKISAKISALSEQPITSIADMFNNMLEEENRELRKQNKQMEIVLDQIEQRKVAGQEEIKRQIERLVNPKKRRTQKIIEPEAGDDKENETTSE